MAKFRERSSRETNSPRPVLCSLLTAPTMKGGVALTAFAVSLGAAAASDSASSSVNLFATGDYFVNPAYITELDASIATATGDVKATLQSMRTVGSAYWIDTMDKVRGEVGRGVLRGSGGVGFWLPALAFAPRGRARARAVRGFERESGRKRVVREWATRHGGARRGGIGGAGRARPRRAPLRRPRPERDEKRAPPREASGETERASADRMTSGRNDGTGRDGAGRARDRR